MPSEQSNCECGRPALVFISNGPALCQLCFESSIGASAVASSRVPPSRVPPSMHQALSAAAATHSKWDRQGLAATWILAAPILGRKNVERWIDFTEHEIDFPEMLAAAGAWSHGETLMIRAANDLYNGDETVGLDELVSTLDDGNLRIVLDAISIRRGWRL